MRPNLHPVSPLLLGRVNAFALGPEAPDTEPTDEELALVMREARELVVQRGAQGGGVDRSTFGGSVAVCS